MERIETQTGGDVLFALTDYIKGIAHERYAQKEAVLTAQGATLSGNAEDKTLVRQVERIACLQSLDTIWMEHLDTMAHLADSVKLRSYGQRDPLVEYKREGYDMFQRAMNAIEKGIVYSIYKIGMVVQPQNMQLQQSEMQKAAQNSPQMQSAQVSDTLGQPSIGRNEPCFCGSGKKYKKCGLLNTPEHQQRMSTTRT